MKRLVLALAAIALVAVAFLVLRARTDGASSRTPDPLPTTVAHVPPGVSVAPPTPDQKKQAADLRERAHAAAAAKDWSACFRAYDAAELLDPDGKTSEQANENGACVLELETGPNAKPRVGRAAP
jgi:hypothetical protein